MEAMFSGFDDGEWWLVVLGCRAESEVAGDGRKLAQKCHKIAVTTGGKGLSAREKEEREVG